MLETAIVLPVVLLIFFATIEFGFILGRYQIISYAASQGARVASLYRGPSCAPSAVLFEVTRAVRASADLLGMVPGDVQVEAEGLCLAGDTRVEATYRHRWMVLPGFSGLPFIDLVGVAVARNQI